MTRVSPTSTRFVTITYPYSGRNSTPITSGQLEAQCQLYLRHGLAPSTHRTYASGQRSFVRFCQLANRYSANGTSLPADEWTLCLFATWLAKDLKVASIKVYLSAVRALHIEQGYTDPMSDCLLLQRVLKGIKRCQGASPDTRLPITPAILRSIFRLLDMSEYDDVLFWAACCLAYFGFLRSSEFTVPNADAFSPDLHLSVNDISVDRRVDPSQIHVNIKVSKTDPFRHGCIIALGQGRSPLCPVEPVSIRGGQAHYSCERTVSL